MQKKIETISKVVLHATGYSFLFMFFSRLLGMLNPGKDTYILITTFLIFVFLVSGFYFILEQDLDESSQKSPLFQETANNHQPFEGKNEKDAQRHCTQIFEQTTL